MVGKKSALGWLNTLMPAPGGARRVATDIAYGPHPRQRLDTFAPMNFERKCPVLFFVYGGGWNSGSKSDYEFVGRAYAGAGFLTVIADYRLVPEIHYPEFLRDLARALNWTLAEAPAFGGDAEQLFLMGHSAGAYNALMLGLDGVRYGTPDISHRIKGLIGLSGPYDFYPFDVAESIATFSRAERPELTQPVKVVPDRPPPAYLGHGSDDETCLPRNTKALARKLREARGYVIERHYEGTGHAATLLSLFPLLRWRTPAFRETLHFMSKELGRDVT